jgi:hypothetical protein
MEVLMSSVLSTEERTQADLSRPINIPISQGTLKDPDILREREICFTALFRAKKDQDERTWSPLVERNSLAIDDETLCVLSYTVAQERTPILPHKSPPRLSRVRRCLRVFGNM